MRWGKALPFTKFHPKAARRGAGILPAGRAGRAAAARTRAADAADAARRDLELGGSEAVARPERARREPLERKARFGSVRREPARGGVPLQLAQDRRLEARQPQAPQAVGARDGARHVQRRRAGEPDDLAPRLDDVGRIQDRRDDGRRDAAAGDRQGSGGVGPP